MAGDKKVVIKINLPTSDNKDSSAGGRLREVTEWNIKRLVISGLILLLIFAGLLYMLLKPDPNQDEYVDTIDKQSEINIGTDSNKSITDISDEVVTKEIIRETTADKVEEPLSVGETASKKDNYAGADKILVAGAVKNEKNNPPPVDSIGDINKVKPKQNQLINQWVVRSQLANNIINKEPVGDVKLPFVINQSKARALFYFTEIKNMKGKTVYHQWNHQGKTVFNRKINIHGNRWRASTRKMISNNNLGSWNVKLLDDKQNTMAEITFTVVVDD